MQQSNRYGNKRGNSNTQNMPQPQFNPLLMMQQMMPMMNPFPQQMNPAMGQFPQPFSQGFPTGVVSPQMMMPPQFSMGFNPMGGQ